MNIVDVVGVTCTGWNWLRRLATGMLWIWMIVLSQVCGHLFSHDTQPFGSVVPNNSAWKPSSPTIRDVSCKCGWKQKAREWRELEVLHLADSAGP
jgi:hypothetical protein